MIVILAANVRILARGFAGKIPQHKAKTHFLIGWLCICVYVASRVAVLRVALIDTRLKLPGESIGTIVSTHETIQAAFKANEAFQKRMRESGVKDHVPTKIVILKVRLGDGEHVNPGVHLFQEREKSGQG